MQKKLASILAVVLGACDGANSATDLSAVGDMSVADASLDPSGRSVVGRPIVLDNATDVRGATLEIEGFPSSRVTTAGVTLSIPLPNSACGKPLRLLFDEPAGVPAQPPIARTITVLSPPVLPDCKKDAMLGYMHLVGRAADGILGTASQELAAHGELPAADAVDVPTFLARHRFVSARTMKIFEDGSETFYHGGSIAISDDALGCKRYYTGSLQAAKSGMIPSYVDLAATNAQASFIVVCPASAIGLITLTATGFTDGESNPVVLAPASVNLSEPVIALDWGP